MRRYLIIIIIFLIPTCGFAQFEQAKDSVIQLIGVILTADSLDGVPNASITIKGTNRGTITNNEGVFSIAVLKGDVIEISHVSYLSKEVSIPKNLVGSQHSIVQLMVQDNKYLPVTIIRPRPTKEQIYRDFVNAKVNTEEMEIINRNLSPSMRRMLLRTTPKSAQEAYSLQTNQAFQRVRYQGQLAPQNIFNPAAWMEFINAWKRGDFKKK